MNKWDIRFLRDELELYNNRETKYSCIVKIEYKLYTKEEVDNGRTNQS